MQCPQCNATLEEGTIFCGNCGNQVAPLNAQGGTIAATAATEVRFDPSKSTRYSSPAPLGQAQASISSPAPPSMPGPVTDGRRETPLPGMPSQPRRPGIGGRGRIVLIAALILIVVAAGIAGLLAFLGSGGKNSIVASGASGVVSFRDSQSAAGHTDALKISVSGLNAAPSGSHYYAWLINTESEKILPLGKLVANGQSFSLDFANGGRRNLLGEGNKVEVTLEQGDVDTPSGNVVLSASFPPQAFIHIRHLLFSFPSTPGKIGLLVGLRNQTGLLNAQALLLQNAVNDQKTLTSQCLAQSIIDIIEGKKGAHYQPLSLVCTGLNITQTGDGFGLLGREGYNDSYIGAAKSHAALAANQPDTTDNIRIHAKHVQIAMDNIRGWVTTIDQDALKLLNAGDSSKVNEMVQLANQALNGIDINGDESVDPVPGEAGALTGYAHAQLMAALQLKPGA